MYFIITGTSQHFGRLVINVDQNNIGLFHKGRYINIPRELLNRPPPRYARIADFLQIVVGPAELKR